MKTNREIRSRNENYINKGLTTFPKTIVTKQNALQEELSSIQLISNFLKTHQFNLMIHSTENNYKQSLESLHSTLSNALLCQNEERKKVKEKVNYHLIRIK